MEKMSKLQLVLRLLLYYAFGGIIPFGFLVWRFELFQKSSDIAFGGWGLLAVFFISLFTIKTVRAIQKDMAYSFAKQILSGVSHIVLPLLLATFCIYYMRDIMTELFQFFCIVTVCEFAAVLMNPLPRWEHENNVEKSESTIKKVIESLGLLNKNNE